MGYIRIPLKLKGYFEFTSVLMIFLQGFTLQDVFIVDLKLYYLLLIINSLLLYTIYGFKINKYLLLIIFLISIHAVLMNFIYDIPWVYFIKQVTGISFAAIYFYNVFVTFDKVKMFKIYLNLSLIFCLIALVCFPFNILDRVPNRLDGLMTEPSKFVIVSIPALYFFLKRKKLVPAFILLLGFIFAQSSVGFIAIFIILVLFFFRKSTLKYVGLTLIPLFFVVPYLQSNDNFQLRYNQTIESLNVFKTKKFKDDTNASTFALLKSGYISVNNFMDHPLGTGVGSFAHQHDVYINELSLPKYTKINGTDKLNREDANSLFFRMLSDFGIIGLIAILGFLYLGTLLHLKGYISDRKDIYMGVFVYFVIKLLRMGHYFPEEMFFFLYMFLFNIPKIILFKKSYIIGNQN